MPELTAQNLEFALGLLTPGIVVLFVRSQLLTGHEEILSERVIQYVAVSAIYYAFLAPLVEVPPKVVAGDLQSSLLWAVLVFAVPAIIGILLGLSALHGPLRWLLSCIGIRLIHPVQTAWDWRFGNCTEQWVIVTLKDESVVYGLMGASSFISSHPQDRDIFLEKVYDNDWCDSQKSGIYISTGEIKTVEFFQKQPVGR